jgi:hypothetical protein
MTSGKMYWKGGKEKLSEKIQYLAKISCLNVKDFTKEVEVRLSDANAEDIEEGDTAGDFIIKPNIGIPENHFLFLLENKDENGL